MTDPDPFIARCERQEAAALRFWHGNHGRNLWLLALLTALIILAVRL